MEPSVPAPVRSGAVDIQLPDSLDTKMTLADFNFIKVSQLQPASVYQVG